MKQKNFDEIAKEEFNFLEIEYGFKLSKSIKDEWGYVLIYMNDKTGVKIDYEYQEAYIFITLYELVQGELKENPKNIDDKTHLFGFALDDIIGIRNSNALVKPAYEYGDKTEYYDKNIGFQLYVSLFAHNLKTYANDVLIGDFNIFPSLSAIVKDRVKKYRK